ncbi:hypothetical protein IFT48_04120 [Pseudomonas fluorescens]|uniref:hypothetical protein n=1 Tax=Pseudomonas fluorescens TaxID=294 RepID=UPI0019309602|nr:hypothetical protein [Pseudomonas fluorescens]MBD8089158.1 hypothetical protein [Pseudomonas fluorescens]
MTAIDWLPSYARPGEGVVFDKATLRTGKLQDEALTYFKLVSQQVAPTELKDTFRALIDNYPGARKAQGEFVLKDNFLIMTVALALLKDIGPLAPHITNDNVPLGAVTAHIKDLTAGLELDLVDQLTRKADVDLKTFCKLYSVSAMHLALKAVADDNAQAFAVIEKEDPQTIHSALARVPYNPLSAIREHIGKPPSEISFQEMDSRIRNQYTALYDHVPLINPNKPVTLQPLEGINYEAIQALNHQLMALPGYLPALNTYQNEYLGHFGVNCRQVNAIETDQQQLIANLIEDMEKAGISRIDILMKGVLKFSPASNDLHWNRPPEELKAQYLAMTTEQKQAMYLPMLLDNAAHYGDDPKGWQSQSKLLQLNHFLSREPIETLEALCTTGSHWNALYRVTGDRKYVAKLGDRVDKVFGEDLGL